MPTDRFRIDSHHLDDEKALLVAAIRIRAELNAELARSKPPLPNIPNSTHHARSMSPSNSNASSSQSHMMSTPLQSPVPPVATTPSSATSAVGKSVRTKKAKIVRGSTHVHNRQKHGSLKRKKTDVDPNAPKKPSNAFFWFCQEKRAPLQEKFRGEGMSGQHDLTKALARLWSETAAEDKKVCDGYYLEWGACLRDFLSPRNTITSTPQIRRDMTVR